MNNLKILKFGAEWCGPCRMMKPIIIQAQKALPDISIEDVDIDENPDLALKYNIGAVPTIVFLKDEVEQERVVGILNVEQIAAKVNRLSK
jgi:thioredoxin 1